VFGALRDAQLLDERTGAAALDLLPGPTGAPTGRATTTTADEAAAAQFRSWDTLTELLVTASGVHPLLVVLDDVHWADASSARLLHHVVERAESARLVVLVTRRRHPEPSGWLADLAAALGRRHALQMGLAGLDAEATRQLVAATTGAPPSPRQAEQLRARTDGNPFFLVELLRWTAPPDVPTDVPGRRHGRRRARGRRAARRHPGRAADRRGARATRSTCPCSAGRRRATRTRPRPAGAGPRRRRRARRRRGGPLPLLARARARRGVRGLPPSRRARRHAAWRRPRRAAASARTDGLRSETAWHWLASGPAHARRAWQAAQLARGVGDAVHAHEDAAELLAAALRRRSRTPSCSRSSATTC
jgi:hypothetical protein